MIYGGICTSLVAIGVSICWFFIPLLSSMYQLQVKFWMHSPIHYTDTDIMGNQSAHCLALLTGGCNAPHALVILVKPSYKHFGVSKMCNQTKPGIVIRSSKSHNNTNIR